ncbi:CsgG/HfaB family protein [Nitrospira sp. Nam74]
MNGPFRYSGPLVACLMAFNPGCSHPSSVPVSVPANRPVVADHSHVPLPTPTVLSIFSFEDRTQMAELAWLRTGLVDMLIAELANNPSLIIVQRERVDEIIREQAFQLSGRVTDESTVKIGRLIGANVFVTGRMIVADGVLRLDAQLVGVEQGTVLGAVAAEGRLHEVSTVARLLVERLGALFPTAANVSAVSAAGMDMLQTAKANHDGEQLSREGRLFEALAEYERALALNPNNAVAQSRLTQTLQHLPVDSWVKAGHTDPDQHGLSRIMERLVLGLETEIGPPSVDAVGAARSGLRMPVRIRLSPVIVDEVLEAFKEIGGVSVRESEQDDTRIVRFDDHPEWMERLARDKSLARRVCVRLLSAEGLTIAVYSDFRAWALSNWIAVDGSTLRIRRAHVLQSQARFDELTPEQGTTITSVRVTIDRVPQERATVRLDVQIVNDQPNAKETVALPPESRSERYKRVTEQEASMLDGVLPLRALMEAAWFPPVTARPWSRGYRPGNDRTVVITLTLDPAKLRVREEPRLVLASGDLTFDQTALAAVRTGLQQWLALRGSESPSPTAAVPSRGADPSGLPVAGLKVRVQFQLHQDVPALNLVGPRALAHPLMPLRSSPGLP